ncbi:MAG: molybdenum cofactor guanylyltransferase MobA [Hyphomicrobiales bacterium]|nr:molybdenum cofactor guanylyltransferase MobA [Hyphomicrobiales bacterium]
MNVKAYPCGTVAGLVLAGGQARRMGGVNKALALLKGEPLLSRCIRRLEPQCATLLISANDASIFCDVEYPVIADQSRDFPGPLAGILAALDWVHVNRPETEWLLSAPVDCPFLPGDLGTRLWAAAVREDKPLALAASGGRPHFVCGLWRMDLRGMVRQMLVDKGIRRVEAMADASGYGTAAWPVEAYDPFFNINTPADLSEAARLLS